MTKFTNLDDLKNITSNITSFSHAYLFNVNSLELAYPYIKNFVKEIILGKDYDINNEEIDIICHQIDNEEYDDFYVVNPDTIGINTDEINRLMIYMQTKSLRQDGKRVYVIYGFERLSRDVSNKILKFLEEPNENVYALLMTENIEKILPTIISRCQIINMSIATNSFDIEKINKSMTFLNKLLNIKNDMIAYEYEYLGDIISDRLAMYDFFMILEKIFSETINEQNENKIKNDYVCDKLMSYSKESLIKCLDITNRLKCLIKKNINLNLLIDRYIIEITEELSLCKK